MNLADHLNPIEQAAHDMGKYARAARKAGNEQPDIDVQRSLLISMFAQLEVIRLRCETLRASEAYKELGT